MRYMLDTNIASELMRNPSGVASRRAREVGSSICVSIIVAAELRYGSAKRGARQLSRRVETFLSAVPVLPFGSPADVEYGHIRAELEAEGRPIGPNDLLIAAHARALGATVVTANVGEFGRVNGLAVENWLEG